MAEEPVTLSAIRERQAVMERHIADLRKHASDPSNLSQGGVQQIVMAPPDSGERAIHRVEKIAILLAALLVGLLIGGWGLMGRMTDDDRDIKRRQDRYDDYQAMLWQRYPELRPEKLKPKEDKKP